MLSGGFLSAAGPACLGVCGPDLVLSGRLGAGRRARNRHFGCLGPRSVELARRANGCGPSGDRERLVFQHGDPIPGCGAMDEFREGSSREPRPPLVRDGQAAWCCCLASNPVLVELCQQADFIVAVRDALAMQGQEAVPSSSILSRQEEGIHPSTFQRRSTKWC